jgi:hypothetical protein
MSFFARRLASTGAGAAAAGVAVAYNAFESQAHAEPSRARSAWAFTDSEFRSTTGTLFRMVFGAGGRDDHKTEPGVRLEASGWDRVVDTRDAAGRGQVFMSTTDLTGMLQRSPQSNSSKGKAPAKVVTVAALVTVEDADVQSMMRFFSDAKHRPSWDKKVVSIEHIDSVPATGTHCNLTTSRYLPPFISDRDYVISTRSEYAAGVGGGQKAGSGAVGIIYLRTAEHEDAPPRRRVVRVGAYEQAFLFKQRGPDVEVALVFEHENVIKMPLWVERWALRSGVPAYIRTAIAAYQQYRLQDTAIPFEISVPVAESGSSSEASVRRSLEWVRPGAEALTSFENHADVVPISF